MTARTIVVTGTGTDVGKTVVTAAIAVLARTAGARVAVVKPAQTGVAPDEPGDLAEIVRLAGAGEADDPAGVGEAVVPAGALYTLELARYPDPLAPATAARRAGARALTADAVVTAVTALDADLVLVEGAGGLLVHLNDAGETLADVAHGLAVRRESRSTDTECLQRDSADTADGVLLVAAAGLGVLNHAALTAEALAHRGIPLLGTVIGSWPTEPDLAARTNLDDLPRVTGAPLLGVLPAGAAADAHRFDEVARCGLGPALGGRWSPSGTA